MEPICPKGHSQQKSNATTAGISIINIPFNSLLPGPTAWHGDRGEMENVIRQAYQQIAVIWICAAAGFKLASIYQTVLGTCLNSYRVITPAPLPSNTCSVFMR